VAYLLALLLLARRRVPLGLIVTLAAAIQLAPLGAPLLLSSDAWTYWDYGRIAAEHGANPYRDSPDAFPTDPAYPHVGADWRDTTSVYGPVFTLASEPIALAVDNSADAAAWTYKALAAAAMLVATGLATLLAQRRTFACAFCGWNPVLALHAAGGGHNDAWIAALVLGALALAASGRRSLAGAVWSAAVLVKWVPLLFLPLRALEARATRRRLGHVGFAVSAALLIALASWRYGWEWVRAFGPLTRNAGEETSFAIPRRVGDLGVPDDAAVVLFAVAFGLAYLLLLRAAARGRARLGLTAGLLLLATPWLVVWYTAWVVPLAAAEDDRAAQWLALGLCAYLLRQTIPV
jgi:Glycosyltransferase family 87